MDLVFEDDLWHNFSPLSDTRHVAQLLLGGLELMRHLSEPPETALAGREELAESVREETGLPYNERHDGTVLLINGRTNPLRVKRIPARGPVSVLISDGEVVMARLRAKDLEELRSQDGVLSQAELLRASRGAERLEAGRGALFRYPWEIVAENGTAISSAESRGTSPSSLPCRGPRKDLRVSVEADVEEQVLFDVRKGPIEIEEKVVIEAFSRLSGPCHVGRGARIHSALIREGTTIGEGCRVGGEVESSVIYPYSNKAHLGFLGHSMVGEWVNLGAGSQVSDLKNTYGTVRVERKEGRIDSGVTKLGTFVGDMTKISIGCLITSGRTAGVASHLSGSVDRDVPSFTYYDGGRRRSVELRLASVLETQERMMSRRGKKLGSGRRRLIERLFLRGERERRRLGVRKGGLS